MDSSVFFWVDLRLIKEPGIHILTLCNYCMWTAPGGRHNFGQCSFLQPRNHQEDWQLETIFQQCYQQMGEEAFHSQKWFGWQNILSIYLIFWFSAKDTVKNFHIDKGQIWDRWPRCFSSVRSDTNEGSKSSRINWREQVRSPTSSCLTASVWRVQLYKLLCAGWQVWVSWKRLPDTLREIQYLKCVLKNETLSVKIQPTDMGHSQ